MPEIRAGGASVAAFQLRLADPPKRLGKPASDPRLGQLQPATRSVGPAKNRRQVVPRSEDREPWRSQLVRGTDPIQKAWRVNERDRAMAARAQMEFIVLAAAGQRRVEAADRTKTLTAQQHGRRVHQVAEEHESKQVAGIRRRRGHMPWRVWPEAIECPRAFHHLRHVDEGVRVVESSQVSLLDDPPARIHRGHVGPDHSNVAVRAKQLHLRIELPGQKCVVRVEQRNELSASVCEAVIPGGGNAAIRLVQVANLRPVTLHDALRIVRRSVIDDDDLHVLIALAEHALDRRTDNAGAIVGRHDDTDHARNASTVEIAAERWRAHRLLSVADDSCVHLY